MGAPRLRSEVKTDRAGKEFHPVPAPTRPSIGLNPAPALLRLGNLAAILRFVAGAAFVTVLAGPALAVPQVQAPALGETLDRLLKALSPSVVQVICYRPIGTASSVADGMTKYSALEPSRGTFWATGVVMNDRGLILTCAEAVQPGDSLEVRLPDGKRTGATFLAQDASLGVSLLRVNSPGGLVPVNRSPENPLHHGDWLLVLNYTADENRPELRLGTLRGVAQDPGGFTAYLHFTLPDCQGTCGGVVVDSQGRFSGMVVDVRAESESERMAGGGTTAAGQYECPEVHALSAQRLVTLTSELDARSRQSSGFLGVRAELMDGFGRTTSLVDGSTGAGYLSVVRVLPGSPAEIAGVLPGDQILEIAGRPVTEVAQISTRIASLPPGTEVQIKILRQGAPLVLIARLVDRSALEWMEREKEMDLQRQKRLNQSIRQLQIRLDRIQQRIARYR
jgi:serine protease DegQ